MPTNAKQKADEVSVLQVAKAAGMEQHTCRKWLKADGLKPVRVVQHGKRTFPYYELEAALAVVLPHKGRSAGARRSAQSKEQSADSRPHEAGAPAPEPNEWFDPETGLSWHQAKLREEALGLRRANERARRLEADEIMLACDHHAILGAVIGRIEQVPGKAQSELGLGPSQVTALRRMLDEARVSAAKVIEEGKNST